MGEIKYTAVCFNCSSLQKQINHRLEMCKELHNIEENKIKALENELKNLKASTYDEIIKLKKEHAMEIKKQKENKVNSHSIQKIGFSKETISVKDIKKFKSNSKHNTY